MATPASPRPSSLGATTRLSLDTTARPVPLRLVNGVNGAGVSGNYWLDLTPWYQRWQIPVARLHDAPFDAHNTVDLHHLFPDPTADPDDPDSYEFALTDDLLGRLRDAGIEIYFRLGESIEHQPRLMWNSQHRWDPEALARVCANVVRHYNHGWADGHAWGIRWWEFWNEPHGPKNWDGTPQELFDRYDRVAHAIKQVDPELRVGLSGFATSVLQPDSAWGQGIAELAERGVPVDFVSWHAYLPDLGTITTASRAVRAFLDDCGLTGAESHLGEWSLRPVHGDGRRTIFSAYKAQRHDHVARLTEQMQGPAGLAHTLGALLVMQSAPIDQAHYYSANTSPRWGLFDASGQPNHRGLAFDIFAQLLRSGGDHWPLTCSDPEVVGAAVGRGKRGLRVVVANVDEEVDLARVTIEHPVPLVVDQLTIHDAVDRLAILPPATGQEAGRTIIDVPLAGSGVAVVDLVPGTSEQLSSAAGAGTAGDW